MGIDRKRVRLIGKGGNRQEESDAGRRREQGKIGINRSRNEILERLMQEFMEGEGITD